jgi:hypothetical protein
MSIREAIVWANCDHPGLLPFEGTLLADSDPERVYLVSPFLEFGTVVSYLVANPDVDRRLLVRTPALAPGLHVLTVHRFATSSGLSLISTIIA